MRTCENGRHCLAMHANPVGGRRPVRIAPDGDALNILGSVALILVLLTAAPARSDEHRFVLLVPAASVPAEDAKSPPNPHSGLHAAMDSIPQSGGFRCSCVLMMSTGFTGALATSTGLQFEAQAASVSTRQPGRLLTVWPRWAHTISSASR